MKHQFPDAASGENAPSLTVEDLAFLVRNRVALRFQHSEYEQLLQKQGLIKGDAYALGYPREWNPPTPDKCIRFEVELKNLVSGVFTSEMTNGQKYDGCFSLFKDIPGVEYAVTDRSYKGPFYPVGWGHAFRLDKRIGQVDVSNYHIVREMGWNREFNPEQVAIRERIITEINSAIIAKIQEARLGGNQPQPGSATGLEFSPIK